MASGEALGDLRGCDEVGTCRRTGKQAVFASGASRHRECVRLRYVDYLVVVVEAQHRRPSADPATLDVMHAGRAP
jgi:hypothetical protein